MDDEAWERYLYETVSREQLRGWARRLQYFRFCRDYGGHHPSAGGDHLLVKLAVGTEEQLVDTMAGLGVPLATIGPNDRVPEPGHSYAGEEWHELASPIAAYPHFHQPRWVRIAEVTAFAWIHDVGLTISLTDEHDKFLVTESAVVAAERVELVLSAYAHLVVDPPQADRNCICPAYYPELWTGRGPAAH